MVPRKWACLMGIENRDYVRGSSSGYDGYGYSGGVYSPGMPPACKWILILTIAVFVVQLVWTTGLSEARIEQYRTEITKSLEDEGATPEQVDQVLRHELPRLARERDSVAKDAFELAPDKVFPGLQVWRLVTYAFCHDEHSPWHILLNMLIFWYFAPTLERMYGTREFVWFYLTSGGSGGVGIHCLGTVPGENEPRDRGFRRGDGGFDALRHALSQASPQDLGHHSD